MDTFTLTNKPKTDAEILKGLAQKYPRVFLNELKPADDGSLGLSVQSKTKGVIPTKALDDIVKEVVKLKVSNLEIITPEDLPDFKVLLQSKSLKTVYVANPPFNSFSVSEVNKMAEFLVKHTVKIQDFYDPEFVISDASNYKNLIVTVPTADDLQFDDL